MFPRQSLFPGVGSRDFSGGLQVCPAQITLQAFQLSECLGVSGGIDILGAGARCFLCQESSGFPVWSRSWQVVSCRDHSMAIDIQGTAGSCRRRRRRRRETEVRNMQSRKVEREVGIVEEVGVKIEQFRLYKE